MSLGTSASAADAQWRQKVYQAHEQFKEALSKLRRMLLDADADPEAALQFAQQLAGFAWLNSCGLFVSTELESILGQLGQHLDAVPRLRQGPEQRKVLLVMSSAHGVGGHSRIAWRWVQNDTLSRVTLVLTAQDRLSVPQPLIDLHAQGRMDLVLLDEARHLQRAQRLRHLAMQADFVVLLTHPNDALPLVALGEVADAPPVIFMDHAAHTFWLGLTLSSMVLSMSAICLESRRGVPRRHIGWAPLPVDTARLDVPVKKNVRQTLGIPPDVPLLLTVGTPYKFWPIQGESMASVMAPVLAACPSAHFVVVGVALQTPFWDELVKGAAGRVHFVGYVGEKDLASYYQACCIYVDSFPFSSPTALFEAAALGKPIVKYAPEYARESEFSLDIETVPTSLYVWSDIDALVRDVEKLVGDPEHRTWRGEFGRRAVRTYHAEDTFRHAIDAAYERVVHLTRIVPQSPASSWRCEMLDVLLVELTANMARQTALESKEHPSPARHVAWPSSVESLQRSRAVPRKKHYADSTELPDRSGRVVVVLEAGDERRLQETRMALQCQTMAPATVIDRSSLVSWGQLQESSQAWVIALCPGDVLVPEAVAELDALMRVAQPEICIVYFDHAEQLLTGALGSPVYKPGYNPDLLHSMPYMGRVIACRLNWLKLHAPEDRAIDVQTAYQLCLIANQTAVANAFSHISQVLVHTTELTPSMFVSDTTGWQRLAQVISDTLDRTGSGASALEGPAPGTFRVIYPLTCIPKVSIIIPTRDQLPFLSRCIESLLDKTDYPDYEILVVDNDSETEDAKAFLSGLEVVDPGRIRVLRVPGPFNFSRMNNLAVAQARGDFILLLNNDTAALHADWLSHMMRHALRDGVGIVGARLLYPEGTVQHAGVIMGLRGPAEHPCLGLRADEPGYMFRAQLTQNFSAVTGACMLVSKAVYEEVGGLDEHVFAVSYNDVDFCLRVGKTGRRIVWTPLATLLHEGSASQKADIENIAKDKKAKRFTREQAAMYERWPEVIANDPAYNPNLSLVERGYEVETNPLLCYDPLKGLVDHRVVAFAADAFGCGNYRILQPMQAMVDAGLCSGGASPELFGPNLALRSGADTLVFQRPSSDSDLVLLESLLPLKNTKKIYEVDDDLSRVPIKSAHREHMPKDIRARMIRNIGMCDRLVVSTEPLAHQLRGSNDDIRVVLNRLPPAMWGDAPPVKRGSGPASIKPRAGWAGGISHQGDLELIAQVVRDTADQVDWIFFGMCPEVIRPYVKEFYAGVPTLDYPNRLMELARSWDLAVAPLEINPFNESKSNLRLLEYGWCGLPVVCSDITPYQGALPVRRVKNRYKDWRAAILEAVNEREASRQMGQALQQRVHSDWMLKGDNLKAWYEAWTGD